MYSTFSLAPSFATGLILNDEAAETIAEHEGTKIRKDFPESWIFEDLQEYVQVNLLYYKGFKY